VWGMVAYWSKKLCLTFGRLNVCLSYGFKVSSLAKARQLGRPKLFLAQFSSP
jgi:hypothetical protein